MGPAIRRPVQQIVSLGIGATSTAIRGYEKPVRAQASVPSRRIPVLEREAVGGTRLGIFIGLAVR